MKFMKKIMAAVAASAVAVLSFASLTASADLKAKDEAPYNAFLAIQAGGDSKWVSSTDDPAVVAKKNSITEATEATITGDGSIKRHQNFSVIAQGYTVATTSLVHIRRRNKNRNTFAFQLRQHIPKFASGNGIDPSRRLIEK